MMKIDRQLPYCYLRFLHGIPSYIALDFYVDDHLMGKDLLFQDFTNYQPLTDKEHTFSLYKHREKEVLFSKTIVLCAYTIYTLMVYPTENGNLQFLLLAEPPKRIPESHFLARVINISVSPQSLKLVFKEKYPEFKRCASSHYTSYLSFPPDYYDLLVYDQTTDSPICFHQDHILFKPMRYYALYLLGGTSLYPLTLSTTIEGNSLLSFDISS